ncbi:hypothetical protein BC940DRAFT_28157 [Gongronella butleri]|nr:hypothetical protein BC940DRAFT_28157 [Gongronella butleri]
MSVPDAPAEATTPLFGSAPLHTDSLHIVPWTHPAIYGHNSPFSIRAAYNPPASFKSALQDDPVRVVASLSPASLLVTTTKKIYVFSPENPALEWVVGHGQSGTVPPWACLTGDGVLMITNDGKLAFWRSFDATGAPDSTDTISLGYNETISAISATPSAVIVGTTVGNLYFIQTKPNIIAFSLYKKPIPSSRFSAFWTYLSPGADINAAGRIIKITPGHAPHEWLVFSSTLIQIWSLDPDAEAKMHYAIQIKDYIQTNVVPGLVSEIPAGDAAIQILDFAKYENNGWIALLTFRDGQKHRIALLFMRQQQEFETTDVVTLPDALTSTPSRATLHISDNDALAFVTVNDVISVVVIPSRNVFESRLILRQRDNQPNHILATIPAPNADETSNTCLVLTSASGILQFTLNPSHIQRFDATEAEVHVLRSQLEQAVFFGDNQRNPLAFPVTASCSDSIGNVACALASDIVNGGTPLMPTTMEMSVLLTHRLRCVKRIPEILKAQHLLAKVDQPTLAKLLRFAEAAQISLEIYNQVIEAQYAAFFSKTYSNLGSHAHTFFF